MRSTLVALAIFVGGMIQAQDMRFGVKAGLMVSSYDAFSIDSHIKGYDIYDYTFDYYNDYTDDQSSFGVYLGGFGDFALSGKFRVQPEINLSFITGDFSYVSLNIPVLAKYEVFDGFFAMAGPGFNYAFNADNDKFSGSFDLGASYGLSKDIFAEVRADIGLNGYLNANLNAGIGYSF